MRKIDLPTLKKSAAAYLGRYATSSANLERVLQRRIQRWCRLNGGDSTAFSDLVTETVAFCVTHGLVDDAAFAEVRTATLRNRGWPSRRIRAGLAQKGLARDVIETALEQDEIGDEAAAMRFAQRRRLGPWRLTGRADKRERDIAAMMRAGFGMDLARATIDRPDDGT
jgi:regulatory protein